MMASPYLIGIGAGIVAAILFVSLATNTALAMLLFYLTPLPLLLARFCWGRVAAQLAVVTAITLVGLVISLNSSIFYALSIALPALVLGHLALLNRAMLPEDPEGRPLPDMPPVVEWYPPGRLIAWAAVMAGALGALALALLGGGAEHYHQAIRKIFQEAFLPQLQNAGVTIDPARGERWIAFVSRLLLPALLAIGWMFILLINLWLAARSASISGLLTRPWPSFANLEYPPLMTVGFVASVGLALLPGMPGIMAMSFVGAFGFAYLLLGLVVLHLVVADSPFKPLLLAGVYLAILFVDWGSLIVAMVGLAEPFLELRQRALKRPAPPKSGKN